MRDADIAVRSGHVEGMAERVAGFEATTAVVVPRRPCRLSRFIPPAGEEGRSRRERASVSGNGMPAGTRVPPDDSCAGLDGDLFGGEGCGSHSDVILRATECAETARETACRGGPEGGQQTPSRPQFDHTNGRGGRHICRVVRPTVSHLCRSLGHEDNNT